VWGCHYGLTFERRKNMRDIKFRAWDKETNQMRFPEDLEFPQDTTLEMRAKHPNGSVYECIPMQFTGFKDAFDRDLYDGDIITGDCDCEHCDRHPAPIRWNEAGYWECADTPLFDQAHKGRTYGELLGNIYENPEFLKQ